MTQVVVQFPGVNDAVKGQLAQDLARDIKMNLPNVNHLVTRERVDTQDAGTLVSIVLAAPAIVAFVDGLWMWMKRRNQSEVTILLPSGEQFSLRNLNSDDVPRAIEKLQNFLKS
ncbi:hypothetical protein [Rhizobium sp. WYCCWR 11128]|uniref:hypothetical protein n=1 Tax=Rhizobium sp. WYCCWR 11128 TaxID=2749832 RepID=UPI0015D1DDCF|nr:hypothetical protein [Rhizobium sp. WYCCWR 11128]NYT30859.1 hypothetical protein [Rhizobium sp. WYCCWR 11128]